MIQVSAEATFPGDIVKYHDWQLHVTGSGVEPNGLGYITTTEFGDMHLHLERFLTVDPQHLETAAS